MCLAVPLKVLKIVDDKTLMVESGGLDINVSSVLIGGVNIDDYVLVHAGFAIQKLTKKEAEETLSIISGELNV
jgi:hydrogenase expression/formation protein HypC